MDDKVPDPRSGGGDLVATRPVAGAGAVPWGQGSGDHHGQVGVVWYRYEDRRYANPLNEWGEPTGSHTVIELRELPLIKITRCGAWLQEFASIKEYRRFCRKDANIPWASPTKEEALRYFIERKKWQRRMRQNEVDRLDSIIAKAESDLPEGDVW